MNIQKPLHSETFKIKLQIIIKIQVHQESENDFDLFVIQLEGGQEWTVGVELTSSRLGLDYVLGVPCSYFACHLSDEREHKLPNKT